MKTQRLRDFLTFILTAIEMFVFTDAHAQVVYTDVNPDQTFTTNGSLYPLDLDNDGTSDFEIKLTSSTLSSGNCPGSKTNYHVKVTPDGNNKVAKNVQSGIVESIDVNTIIKNNTYMWSANADQVLAEDTWKCDLFFDAWIPSHAGKWSGDTDKYLGLRMKIGQEIYFGWVRLDVNSSSSNFTVKDYAFQKQKILAGQNTTDYIVCLPLTSSIYCAGNTVNIPYQKYGSFTSNTFSAELSDVNGSFGNPVLIGNIISNGSGTIAGTIPATTKYGKKYRIRVTSTNPERTSYDNGLDITIDPLFTSATITHYQGSVNDTSVCAGSLVVLHAPDLKGYSYQWKRDGVNMPGAIYDDQGILDSAGSYSCLVTNACGESLISNSIHIEHFPPAPDAIVTAMGPTTVCADQTVTLNANTSQGLNYQWNGWYAGSDDTLSSLTITSVYYGLPNGYYVTETDSNGCSQNSESIEVRIFDPAPVVFSSLPDNQNPYLLCMGDSVTIHSWADPIGWLPLENFAIHWKRNGNEISGATNSYYTAHQKGNYQVTYKNLTGDCYAASDTFLVKLISCLMEADTGVATDHLITCYPNPFSQSTIINFRLVEDETVSLKIFDVQGRLIRTLASENMIEGAHEFSWDASNENGNAVSAGIYFLRLQTTNASQIIQLNVIR